MREEEAVVGTTMGERAFGMERKDDFDMVSMGHAFWPQPGVLPGVCHSLDRDGVVAWCVFDG